MYLAPKSKRFLLMGLVALILLVHQGQQQNDRHIKEAQSEISKP